MGESRSQSHTQAHFSVPKSKTRLLFSFLPSLFLSFFSSVLIFCKDAAQWVRPVEVITFRVRKWSVHCNSSSPAPPGWLCNVNLTLPNQLCGNIIWFSKPLNVLLVLFPIQTVDYLLLLGISISKGEDIKKASFFRTLSKRGEGGSTRIQNFWGSFVFP